MRKRSGAPLGTDLLEHAGSHPDPDERARIHAVLEDEEERGFERVQLMPDVDVLLSLLEASAVRMAVLTRNNDDIMARTIKMLRRPDVFSLTLSRSFAPTKPHPAPLLHICREWGCDPSEVVMVGDSIDDMQCGRAAGARTLLVGAIAHEGGHDAGARALSDAAVATLTEAAAVLRAWDPRLSGVPDSS
jgi:HAD superfamily hydrolase (TIGR01549 family)